MELRAKTLALVAGAVLGACGGPDEPAPTEAPAAEAEEDPAEAEPAPGVEVHARRVTVGPVDLHYLEAGDADAPAVVLLHGAAYQAETWRELGTLDLLVESGFRVLAFDLPSGRGPTPDVDFDTKTFLGEVLDLLELERPVVVSPSKSGRVSLPLVVGDPNRLAGYVPIAPVHLPGYLDRLYGNPTPTLIVWGDADTVLHPSHANDLHRILPNSEKVLLERAAHACYLDATEAFHERLVRFLRDVFDR